MKSWLLSLNPNWKLKVKKRKILGKSQDSCTTKDFNSELYMFNNLNNEVFITKTFLLQV